MSIQNSIQSNFRYYNDNRDTIDKLVWRHFSSVFQLTVMMEKLIHFGRNEIDLYRILLEFDSPFIRESHEYLSDRNFGNQLSPFDRQELATLIVLHQKLNRILVDFSTGKILNFIFALEKKTYQIIFQPSMSSHSPFTASCRQLLNKLFVKIWA